MIKSSTVIKRMIARTWKPATFAIGTIGSIAVISVVSGRYFDIEPNIIYWALILALFIATGLKWSYDWNKSAIEMEQKQMLRDIEKKHL